MVTEFEIRRELAAVESMRLDGLAKARRLLKIARRVRTGAFKMAHLSLVKLQEGDAESAARFRTAGRRLVDLHDEIRANAGAILRAEKDDTRELMEVMA